MEATQAAIAPGRRLGKRPPKFDARTLSMAKYLKPRTALPKVPKSFSGTRKVRTFPMYRNDAIGDCTCAALGHMTQVWSAWARSPETPPEPDIVALYSKVSGYDPVSGANDNGAYLLDVLNYSQNNGFADEALGTFAAVDPLRHDLIRFAIWMFGGVYAGFNLPITAQRQKVWDYVPGANGNQPGSWGGHCVPVNDFTAKQVRCVTWGKTQPMTWAFIDRYCDEAYAIINDDWLNRAGKNPAGFDLQALQNDLNAIHR